MQRLQVQSLGLSFGVFGQKLSLGYVKSLCSAFVFKAYMLLIAFCLLDGDVKLGGLLDAF